MKPSTLMTKLSNWIEDFSWAWYNKCNALLSLGGRYNDAIKAIDSPVILDPSNEWAWIDKSNALSSLLGKYGEAIESC